MLVTGLFLLLLFLIVADVRYREWFQSYYPGLEREPGVTLFHALMACNAFWVWVYDDLSDGRSPAAAYFADCFMQWALILEGGSWEYSPRDAVALMLLVGFVLELFVVLMVQIDPTIAPTVLHHTIRNALSH